MRKAIALVLVLALVLIANAAAPGQSHRFATMALGLVLIAATLVGEAGERIHIPRVTGYLLVGMAIGPGMLGLLTPQMTSQLRLVNGLAVALIAFTAGMELDLPELRRHLRSLFRHGSVLIGILFLGLFVAALLVSMWLPFTAGESWPFRIAFALLLAAVMTTFSPTVTMAVIAETRARGPLTERILALVVLGDLAVLLLFTMSTATAQLLLGSSKGLWGAIAHAAWELVSSPLAGLAGGAAIVVYRRLVDRRSGLVVAGMCLLLAEVGSRLGISALLSCLVAGMIVRNVTPDATHAMEELVARVRMPVLVVFFAATGASLHLEHLVQLGPLALGIVVVRGGLIFWGNRAGARAGGVNQPVAGHVPFGLISQAGVTLGLAVIVGRDFGALGAMLETLFVATISVHELIGPVAFRAALQRLGEIPPPEVREETPGPLPAG